MSEAWCDVCFRILHKLTDTTSYACIQPLELCSTDWSKFPLFAAPLPRLNPHWQPSHIHNNPQAVIAIKKTLFIWLETAVPMNTHHHGEWGEQNAAERSTDIQTKERNLFKPSTDLFLEFSCFIALTKKTLTQFWVLGQHVVFRWLLQINFEFVFSVPASEFLQSCEKR